MEASSALKHLSLPPGTAEASLANVIHLVRGRLVGTAVPPAYEQLHGRVQVPHCEELTPWTLNIPYAPTSPFIHVIVPGFGGFKRSSRDLRNSLSVDEGVAALSFDPIRKGGNRDLRDSQRAHKDTIPAILEGLISHPAFADKAKAFQLRQDRVVFVPHSMGGISAIEHAVNHPSEVSHIVALAIAGLEGQVATGYGSRLFFSAKNEIIPAISNGAFGGWRNTPHMARKSAKYYLSNGKRTIGEMASLYQLDLRPRVAALGSLGVAMAMVNFELDELVSAAKSQQASGEYFDITEMLPGLNHLAPQTHPRIVATVVGRLSRQLLQIQGSSEGLTKAA